MCFLNKQFFICLIPAYIGQTVSPISTINRYRGSNLDLRDGEMVRLHALYCFFLITLSYLDIR